jgi:hypothetical protein
MRLVQNWLLSAVGEYRFPSRFVVGDSFPGSGITFQPLRDFIDPSNANIEALNAGFYAGKTSDWVLEAWVVECGNVKRVPVLRAHSFDEDFPYQVITDSDFVPMNPKEFEDQETRVIGRNICRTVRAGRQARHAGKDFPLMNGCISRPFISPEICRAFGLLEDDLPEVVGDKKFFELVDAELRQSGKEQVFDATVEEHAATYKKFGRQAELIDGLAFWVLQIMRHSRSA